MHRHSEEKKSSPSIWMRMLAVVILAVAAWVLLKLVIGVLVTVAWIVAVVVALVGIGWAITVLRR